ncbi:hypothetical protein ABZ807_23910 [Micromonospora sp. NPDC047548]|uniref:hypothetical protein n=1 Tax=Micromonospora sp. NPDC047548 TaxID=3155624 RepID=UPI0033E66CAE
MQLVSEPAEGALALDGTCKSAAGRLVADPLGEVSHVLIPDVGRQRIDADQVEVVKVPGRFSVDSTVRRPDHDFAGLRVDQPSVLAVGLVGERGGDLL